MLNKNERKFEVTLNKTNHTLVCNGLETFTLVNSGADIMVMDVETGEILFDTTLTSHHVQDAEKLANKIKKDAEFEIRQNERELAAQHQLHLLVDLADYLGGLDDLNHPVTKLDIVDEIRRLREENHKLKLEKLNKDSLSPALRRIYNIHIMDLDLTVRSYNCLKRAGIAFVEDILQMTEEDMIKIRNLGRRSLKEIITKLAELGVALKGSELSFEEKVAVCCKYHNNRYYNECALCPLRTGSVDCFYNESQHNKDHVDIAMGKEPDWLNPDLDLTPTIHPEDEYTADDISEFNSFYEAAGVEDEDDDEYLDFDDDDDDDDDLPF